MKLRLVRTDCDTKRTMGELEVDGALECYSLEDPVREKDGVPVKGWKVQGDTAIPRGTYGVIITYSGRFERDLPLVEGVEGFTGIRIHPGNTTAETEGCILVGLEKTDRTIMKSKAAFSALFAKIQKALDDGDRVTLEIA